MITILGLLVGLIMVIVAISSGGSVLDFVNVPSLFIVVGGTIAVTIASFSLQELGQIPKTLWRLLFYRPHHLQKVSIRMLQISEHSRKKGIIALEHVYDSINDLLFLKKGITLVVDGNKIDEIERVMNEEIGTNLINQNKSIELLRRSAEVAPAMGLIGTLVGLVRMLGNLSDPNAIGPAMAVALLTTFYGAILAHMILVPLAARAERNSNNEAITNSLFLKCITSIGKGENPRRLEMHFNAMLPDKMQIRYFD